MTWKTLSPRSCRESADALQEQLNLAFPVDREVLINWGCSSFNHNDPLLVFGNREKAVGRSANKQLSYQIMTDLGTLPLASKEAYDGPQYQHTNPFGQNGSGIVYCSSPDRWIPNVFSTKEVKGKEYRCYFAYGKTFLPFQKVRVTGNSNSPVHNSVNGWGYNTDPNQFNTKNGKILRSIIEEYTLKVANRIELSYGAVDFIFDGEWVYILETNSAPTLITADLCYFFAERIKNAYEV